LIVEDDLSSANALKRILAHRGFQVEAATTLAEAIPQLDGSIGGIILDLMLPDGDGIAVLHALRERHLNPRVIITTAVSDGERLHELQEFSPTLLLKKPINLAELLRALAD
jgi:DNA-binding response OmpR family regulator